MSKTLSRLRTLVTELDTIQMNGRKSSGAEPFLETSSVAPTVAVEQKPVENVVPFVKTPESAEDGKILIQFKGKIAVQLQLENSDEIVELKQRGESLEISFNDGKAIHLPLKNVS